MHAGADVARSRPASARQVSTQARLPTAQRALSLFLRYCELLPFSAPSAGHLPDLLRKIEKAKARVRAKVEHPFRVIKRQFGYTKVRFRGLAKNTAQLVTLFALSNLWMARRHLLAGAGAVRL